MHRTMASMTQFLDAEDWASAPAAASWQTPCWQDTARRPAILRQCFEAGGLEIDYRVFPRERTISLVSGGPTVHVVVPLAGSLSVSGDDAAEGDGRDSRLRAGSALLLAGGGEIRCVWAAGSRALMLQVPRAAIQAEASRVTGRPRRLAAVNHGFGWATQQLGIELMAPGEPECSGFEVELPEQRVLAALVSALLEDQSATLLFPVAGSVERAIDQMRANPQHGWSPHSLAAVAGVTVGTLRRNFRACLGVSITQQIQQIRLDWVRTRLESETESRSIGDLSRVAGFGASGRLSRAYQLQFGETPSQTRARTFGLRRE